MMFFLAGQLTLGANDGKWLGGAKGVAPASPGWRRPGAEYPP